MASDTDRACPNEPVAPCTASFLRRISWTDCHHDFDGAFSLVSHNPEALFPRRIADDAGSRVIAEHPFDVEVRNVQGIELPNQSMRRLVLKGLPCPLHALMSKGKSIKIQFNE